MTEKFLLSDTGQIKCYDKAGKEIETPQTDEEFYGQNGCFIINTMSFTKLDDNGNKLSDNATWETGLKLVMDNNTGLIWEVKSPNSEDINYADDKYSFQDAEEKYIKKLNEKKYAGHNDWRFPNKDEIRSIIDYSQYNPAIDKWYFPNCKIDLYWCSSTYEMQSYFAWVMFFGLGSATANGKSNLRYVRAVCGGYNKLFGKPDLTRFVDNADETITDKVTNLMWQKTENKRMNWYEALKYAKQMNLAGYNDWRLPNIKELNTILDVSYKDKWWYFRDFFPADGLEPPLLHYFSSTVYEKTYAWVTNFCFGYDGYYASKYAPLLMRAVRNIEKIGKIEKIETKKIFQLPDTGQILCYDDMGNQISPPKEDEKFYAQDGSFNINPLSFTKLRSDAKEVEDETTWEEGWRMIKDNNTGLIWEIKSANINDINYKGDRYNWDDAKNYIEKLNKTNYLGFCDWRFPNKEELRTIVDYNDIVPAIDLKYFPNTISDFYWSKDTYMPNPVMIWGIYFVYGCGICYLKDSLFLIRAVRGGYNKAFGDMTKYALKDNGDGTITDLNTNLMWKKEESPEMTFADALKYCQELKLAGHNDWYLPNMKEIATILDLSYKNSLWYNKEFFPDVRATPLGFYWCSSIFSGTFGWGVNFQFGYDGYYAGKKYGSYSFRPVRIIK